jgi:hypothetical protein
LRANRFGCPGVFREARKTAGGAPASPRYGECWGRHWLDAARYEDSDGYKNDRARPDEWRYRD